VFEDFERCYRAVQSRDERFDGWFFTAVTSTHIYCRPSCPATTPKASNVRFYPTAAAAQHAGFRACLRCRPDAAPGSPEWLGRKDVAARAVKLVLDGLVDREGVSGLARKLGYSERQLHRVLIAEIGTGAISLARAQRAQTARLLLETTSLPVTQVAFAAGFASVRQFNDCVKQIFARTPSELRSQSTRHRSDVAGERIDTAAQRITLRLAYRRPFAAEALFEFLGARAVEGIETFDGGVYTRTMRLSYGEGTVELEPCDGFVRGTFELNDLRDLTTAVARCRHLLNLDSDPVAVDEALAIDPLVGELVKRTPGLRVAGATDGFEIAVRAVVGQQTSLKGARSVLAKLVSACGERTSQEGAGPCRLFPSAAEIAELGGSTPEMIPLTTARRHALLELCESVMDGKLDIDPGTHPAELEDGLLRLHGIGPWTASYVAMRALADPDAFLASDLGLQRAARTLGAPSDERGLLELAERWRPWRAYAMGHLWYSQSSTKTKDDSSKSKGKSTGNNKGESPK
jgi:AraC family transcriptional regulator of adaptative response / DNA-3-methyladenine glycosylase II